MNPNATLPPPVDPLPADTDERDLARRLRAGSRTALEALIDAHAQRVASVGPAVVGLGRRSGRRGARCFPDGDAQSPYVSRRSEIMDLPDSHHGQSHAEPQGETRVGWAERGIAGHRKHPRDAPRSFAGAERDATAEAVRGAVAGLPSGYREVIVLRYLEESSIGERGAKCSACGPTRSKSGCRCARKLLEPELAKLIRGE